MYQIAIPNEKRGDKEKWKKNAIAFEIWTPFVLITTQHIQQQCLHTYWLLNQIKSNLEMMKLIKKEKRYVAIIYYRFYGFRWICASNCHTPSPMKRKKMKTKGIHHQYKTRWISMISFGPKCLDSHFTYIINSQSTQHTHTLNDVNCLWILEANIEFGNLVRMLPKTDNLLFSSVLNWLHAWYKFKFLILLSDLYAKCSISASNNHFPSPNHSICVSINIHACSILFLLLLRISCYKSYRYNSFAGIQRAVLLCRTDWMSSIWLGCS